MSNHKHSLRALALCAAPLAALAGCAASDGDPSDPSSPTGGAVPSVSSVAYRGDARTRAFNERLLDAELVFQGTVSAVSSVLASPAERGGERLPHTFVTFLVERVFKGRVLDRTITLRFLGGVTANGGYMMSSSAPLFDVGERSILLVRGNGVAKTPLVGWRQGRLRVVDGRVYTDEGRDVLTAGQTIGFGRRRALEEVLTHRIAGTTQVLDARQNVDLRPSLLGAVDRTDDAAAQPAAASSAVAANVFSAWLDGAVARSLAGAAPTPVVPVRSADPAAPFVGPSFRPVPAPEAP